MSLRERPLVQTTAADLETLINSATEGQYLDFKDRMYERTDDGKHELAKDVSALANAYGGDLVVGIDEEDGRAARLVPLKGAGKAVEWLLQVCVALIEERIAGLDAHAIPVDDGQVIVVRVPASLRGPHMVRRGRQTYFYRRFGQENLPMSLPDLREAFMRFASWQQAAERFLEARAEEARTHEHVVVGVLPVPITEELVTATDEALHRILRDPPQTRYKGRRAHAGRELRLTLFGLQSELPSHRLAVWRNGYIEVSLNPRDGDWTHLGIVPHPKEGLQEIMVLAHPLPIIQYVVTALRLASAVYAHVGYDGPMAAWMYFRMSPAPHAPPVDLVTDDFWQHLERDAFYSPVPFPIHVPPVVGESAHDPDALARQILERFFHAFNIPSVPYFDGDRPTIPDLLPFSRERSDEVE